jgi:hypothetical protein
MTAENLTTKNKIGYLNPKNGKYAYYQIEAVNVIHPETKNPAIQLRRTFKGLGRYADHVWFDEIERLNYWSNENSADFPSSKKLIKFK